MSVQCVSPKIPVGPSMIRAIGGSVEERPTTGSMRPKKTTPRRPLEFLRIGGGKGRKETVGDDAVLLEREEERNGNWVLKILEVGSIWKGKRQRSGGGDGEDEEEGSKKDESCDLCRIDEEEEEEMVFDRENFSKMLMKIPLDDAQMFAKLSYLGNLAYSIPNIKPENLLKYQKLRFVTSSIEKRSSLDQQDGNNNEEEEEGEEKKLINPAAAYRIAASAASRLFSHSKSVLPFGRRENEASLMATADSVTAVVAAEEEVKQAVADDLKSNHSPPCEWFVCDDDKTGTRINYYQEGDLVHPKLDVSTAFKKALQTWSSWVDKNVDPKRTRVFFRSAAPSHFSGGEWNSGGHCREAKKLLNQTFKPSYSSKNIIVEEVLKQMKTPVTLLNVSGLSQYRIDAHPSIFGAKPENRRSQAVQDCSHWCLPGVPDTWNHFLYLHLLHKR
ncbi:hypothetical protein F2Q70_00041258 [Brassica cretica]|uniref:Trichome birefringence-like C-terminal domain-containing protein n=1 Tax=Brassica cretica TaxID=69181 RepID=A0A8S9K1U2_BRACR|nr:hypothetical protein F2Q70_00041258 [Brassica cretica]